MLSSAHTHAALNDVLHGNGLPAELLQYFVGRGFVEVVSPGTDSTVEPGTPGAEIRLTDAGKACLHGHGV